MLKRYVELVLLIYDENQDVNVKFMHRNKLNLKWTYDAQSSQCWVLFDKVICQISAPSVKGRRARDYDLARDDYDTIVNYINKR